LSHDNNAHDDRDDDLDSGQTLFTIGLPSLRSSNVREDDFIWLSAIGSGSYGEVWKCQNKNGMKNIYAIKKSKKPFQSIAERQRITHQLTHLTALTDADHNWHHVNILKHYNAWCQQNRLYVQTELCEHGDLRRYYHMKSNMDSNYNSNNSTILKKITAGVSEHDVWELIHQISSALAFIHYRKLLHFDVKPDNIYVAADGTYKLGDLGTLIHINEWKKGDNEGDGVYLAPEVLNSDHITTAADIFSFGLTLHTIITGRLMKRDALSTLTSLDWFTDQNDSKSNADADNDKMSDDETENEEDDFQVINVSPKVKQLVELMIHATPSRRPTAHEIVGHASCYLNEIPVKINNDAEMSP
jgi:serine/threonine protein kinase